MSSDNESNSNTAIPDVTKDKEASATSSAALSDKELDQLNIQANAFDALERDFREVLNTLVGDKSLERFRQEYEKLHLTLKKSHDNEKRLIQKCRELNAEIVSNAAKIQTALRLSLQDQASIAMLRKEIDKAWQLVDSAQNKEKKARETIQRLKGEIGKLSRLVDQGAHTSIGQETELNNLMKIKEDLSNEVSLHVSTIEQQQKRAAELQARIQTLDDARYKSEKEILHLKEKVAGAKQEAQMHKRTAEGYQTQMRSTQEDNDKKKRVIGTHEAKLQDLLHQLDDQQGKLDKAISEAHTAQDTSRTLEARLVQVQKELEVARDREHHLLQTKNLSEEENARQKKEIKRLSNDLRSVGRLNDRLEKEKDTLREQKDEAERYRNWLKDEMKAVLKNLERERRDADADDKLAKELQTQVKRLEASLKNADGKNKKQLELVEEGHNKANALESDILSHKVEEQNLRKRNYVLEKAKEKSGVEAANWRAKYEEAMETIKLKEMENGELVTAIMEEKNRLKQQQNLYEQVRSDRNLFSKQQVQAEDQITELKRKFKIMSHQLEQLKEEIANKDQALVSQHHHYKKLQDEMKVLKRKLNKRKEVLTTADAVLASQDTEIKNLRATLKEAEAAAQQQKSVYEDVLQERDILGTQLIRRNDELALLYEKIRIQQSTLNKGELQYRDRLNDIRNLKLSITNIKRQLHITSQEVTNVEALKNELYYIQRELLQERTKVKALSEELENPMNVHRWRKLEGSDPKRFELLQKIQTLQKRLIAKTEEAVEKDLLLQEKETLYQELKSLLARQPGPELAHQLTQSQHASKEKTRQLKAMAAELNMAQAQTQEQRYEIERLTRELQELRRKFFESRRKEQIQKELARAEVPSSDPLVQQQRQFLATQPKIAGGGFALKTQEASLTRSANAIVSMTH